MSCRRSGYLFFFPRKNCFFFIIDLLLLFFDAFKLQNYHTNSCKCCQRLLSSENTQKRTNSCFHHCYYVALVKSIKIGRRFFFSNYFFRVLSICHLRWTNFWWVFDETMPPKKCQSLFWSVFSTFILDNRNRICTLALLLGIC